MSLAEQQAYLAMFHFLERQFNSGAEELGGILGSMALFADGGTADPAMLEEWNEAVRAARAGEVEAKLELRK